MKILSLVMCIDLLPEKHLQVIKKKEKWYEWNTSPQYLSLIIINFQDVILLVVCGTMWDLFIFKATVKPQFLILSHATQWSKKPRTQL